MAVYNKPLPSESLNVAQGSDARIFVQLFGSPLDQAQFMGRISITNALGTERNEPEIIEVPSDSKRGHWVKIGQIDKSLGTGTVEFDQQVDIALADLWDDLHTNNTRFTMYVLLGNKVDHPANFRSYTSALVLQNCSITKVERGATFNPMTSDDAEKIVLSGSAMFWDIEPVRPISVTDISGTVVTRNILDSVVRETNDLRNNEIFAVTTNTATTAPSAVVYYKDNGTITQTNVTALSTDGVVNSILVVGDYAVLLRDTASNESHLWSTLANVRSATTAFTAVTTGYVASKGATGGYVLDVANVWLCAKGGYIYKMSNPTTGVSVVEAGSVTAQNLSAIDGYGQQIIAVGASSAIVLSSDFGSTWVSAPAPTAGLTLTDVCMVAKDTWYLTATNGNIYYTQDAGVTYTTLALPIALTSITGVRFAKTSGGYSSFGYLVGNDATTSYLLRTKDGGNTWENGLPSVKGFGTAFTGISSITTLSLANSHLISVGGGVNLAIGKHN